MAGTVSNVPRPGAIGIFLDLGATAPPGFIDGLALPRSADRWPSVGDVVRCVVGQHRVGQIRLLPTDPPLTSKQLGRTVAQWAGIRARYPVGARVTGRVFEVFPANREYLVRVGNERECVEYRGPEPSIGDVKEFRVAAHLDVLRRLRLEPV